MFENAVVAATLAAFLVGLSLFLHMAHARHVGCPSHPIHGHCHP